jgi:hypothetical protein
MGKRNLILILFVGLESVTVENIRVSVDDFSVIEGRDKFV